MNKLIFCKIKIKNILTCISLATNKVGHISTYFLVICFPLSLNFLFISFIHIFIELSFYQFLGTLCIL